MTDSFASGAFLKGGISPHITGSCERKCILELIASARCALVNFLFCLRALFPAVSSSYHLGQGSTFVYSCADLAGKH
jgi:hypothetical protein